MADPITIATSVLGVASVGFKLASSLYDIKTAYEGAQDSIESIASDLNFFAIVLEELGHVFSAPATQKIVSERLTDSIKQIITQCKVLFNDINKMILKANGATLSRIGRSVAWIFREGKVKSLKVTLDSLKSTLGLMLQTLKLRRAQSKDAEKERVILRNLFNTQQHSVRRLQRVEKSVQVPADEPRALPILTDRSENDLNLKKAPLISAILLNAVPAAEKEFSDDSNSGQNSAKYGASANEIGIHVPVKPDLTRYLLGQWTRPSDPQRATVQPESASTSSSSYYYEPPPASENSYDDPAPELGSDVVELMELFSQKLTKSISKKLSDICAKKEQSNMALKDRLEAMEKGAASDREALNAQHEADMNTFERQLLEKENKENTISSIRLEIERSYSDFEVRVRGRPAASETLQPFLAHLKRLEDRLAAEESKLTELQIALADAKKRVREESTAKLATIQAILDDKQASLTKENEEEIRKLDQEHLTLTALMERNSSEIPKLQSQWLSLVKEVVLSHMDLGEISSTSGISIDLPLSTPDWLDDNVDDIDTEVEINQESESGRDSDKIPVEGAADEDTSHVEARFESYSAENSYTTKVPLDEQLPQSSDSANQARNVDGRGMEVYRCQRQAWKAPLPFQSGSNTLSYVLGLNIEQLWFKASRDEYKFYLGPMPDPFYTVELVPDDLRSSQTSRFEWTVLHKAFANDSALLSSGYIYEEDNDGHVWIRKELNWSQVQQLFDISCCFIDDMLTSASRKVMARRSEEYGEKMPSPSSRSRILPRLRKIKETDVHPEFHGAFFRTKVSEE